ncbi:MAG: hypothetical protein AB9873_12675 [Syntrophobacteraceae bacterium]
MELKGSAKWQGFLNLLITPELAIKKELGLRSRSKAPRACSPVQILLESIQQDLVTRRQVGLGDAVVMDICGE